MKAGAFVRKMSETCRDLEEEYYSQASAISAKALRQKEAWELEGKKAARMTEA